MSLILWGTEMGNSPYVLSCFVALREKQIPFELRTVSLQKGDHRQPPFVTLSLTARVPVLVDGDLSLSESSAIVEYLDEKFPPPTYARVLPVDTVHRARARQVMAWVRSDVAALREERSAEYVFLPAGRRRRRRRRCRLPGQEAAEKVVRVASSLIPDGGGPLFDGWCIADTDLAMMLWRLSRTGYPLPRQGAGLRRSRVGTAVRPGIRGAAASGEVRVVGSSVRRARRRSSPCRRTPCRSFRESAATLFGPPRTGASRPSCGRPGSPAASAGRAGKRSRSAENCRAAITM